MKRLIRELFSIIGVLLALLLIIAVLHPLPARAAGPSATLSWLLPTAYIDGSTLPAADIASVTVSWTRPGSTSVVGSVTVAGTATSTVVNNLVCGNFSFSATVTTTASAANPNLTSGPSTAAAYATGVKCAPNPPGNLAAQ